MSSPKTIHRLFISVAWCVFILGFGAGCAIQAQPLPTPIRPLVPATRTNTPVALESNSSQSPAVAMQGNTSTPTATDTPTVMPSNTPTETPTPTNTPTLLMIPLAQLTLPPKTATPTVTPPALPSALKGKIAFKSDRLEGEDIFVMNPDGSDVALLTDRWAYENALARDARSSDGTKIAFIREGGNPVAMQLFVVDTIYKKEFQVGLITKGNAAWDPAWSPRGDKIAFTSNMSKGDSIYVINVDGSQLTQFAHNNNEWDHHPSWSPDGSKIVFMSNRSGWQQLWIANSDGTGLKMVTPWPDWNNWDPVWIKW